MQQVIWCLVTLEPPFVEESRDEIKGMIPYYAAQQLSQTVARDQLSNPTGKPDERNVSRGLFLAYVMKWDTVPPPSKTKASIYVLEIST